MGNASTAMNRKKNKPRVVLETPCGSETDTAKTTRVSFANVKSNVPTFKAKPQMTDVGTIHPDIYKPKIKIQRNQPIDVSASHTNMKSSKTSVRSTGSVPPDGIWEPTLDPYELSNSQLDNRLNTADTKNRSNSNYTGFAVRDNFWGYRVDNGLAKVEEI